MHMTFAYWILIGVSASMAVTYVRAVGVLPRPFSASDLQEALWVLQNEYSVVAVGVLTVLVSIPMGLEAEILGERHSVVAASVLLATYGIVWLIIRREGLGRSNRFHYRPVETVNGQIQPEEDVVVIFSGDRVRAVPVENARHAGTSGDAAPPSKRDALLTHCACSNLGSGFVPLLEGRALKLQTVAQFECNAILRDVTSRTSLLQIYGGPDHPANGRPSMPALPTFRMKFRGFVAAFPHGEILVRQPASDLSANRLSQNVDRMVFAVTNRFRARQPSPLLARSYDKRLPHKTPVWGLSVGSDATCFTDDFVRSAGEPINTKVGGHNIVVAYDAEFESLGIWIRDSIRPVQKIDFFGRSDVGVLPRAAGLRAGVFWHVWANFFPTTDINRTSTFAPGVPANKIAATARRPDAAAIIQRVTQVMEK